MVLLHVVLEVANTGCSHNRGGRPNWTLSSTIKPQCQVYGKLGHIALDWWHRFNQGSQSSQSQSNDNQASMSAMVAHPIRPSPRASMQISVPQIFLTPNASNLMNKMNYIGNEQIHVEDGTGLSIHVIGSSSFPSQFNSKILSLNQLLHVPYCF